MTKLQTAIIAVGVGVLAAILAVLVSCYCVCGVCGAVSFGKWYVADSAGQIVEVCGECYRETRALDF